MDAHRLTARELQTTEGMQDWRVLGRDAHAWFVTGSHGQGAGLVARVARHCLDAGVEVPPVELRQGGVRVRVRRDDDRFGAPEVELARAVSDLASEMGLRADPAVPQAVQLGIDAMDSGRILPFWQRVLGYDAVGQVILRDPHLRLPPVWFQEQDAPRPLRNRLHLDVVTPQPVATATVAAVPGLGGRVDDHDFYATVADADGNEADVLPLPEGADRWEGAGTEDWRLVFAAMACYPVESAQVAVTLAERVAALADEAGLALGIDLRPGLVVLDSGKDRWEMVEGYEALAARCQEAARGLGLTADVDLPRFVQVGIDAVDIPAVRAFWLAALGYVEDGREGVTDIVDPSGVGMPFFLQDLEADDTARREQRGRIHVDVFVADDRAQERVQAVLSAGGRMVHDEDAPAWWTLADPEGNEVCIAVSPGREELWDE